MDSLIKPLKKRGKIKQGKGPVELRKRLPIISVAASLLGLIIAIIIGWIILVDDPTGGEPTIVTNIIEPQFDNPQREIGVLELEQPAPSNQESQLTELTPDGKLEPINPDDIIITDPSARARQETEEAQIASSSLSTVADTDLIEKSRYGFLPKIASDGRKPFEIYRRPTGAAVLGTARIAIIVAGLGLNPRTTQKALGSLPPETTLAFAPYAQDLQSWVKRARQNGNELLIHAPMEPFDYPNNDPGPRTLLADQPFSQTKDKLHWVLSRMTNYVGVINYMGARLSSMPTSLSPVLTELNQRGLIYVDDGSTPVSRANDVAEELRMPFVQTNIVLDGLPNKDDIDSRLLQLESFARDSGTAVGLISALPISIERVSEWAKSAADRGVILVPISAALTQSDS